MGQKTAGEGANRVTGGSFKKRKKDGDVGPDIKMFHRRRKINIDAAGHVSAATPSGTSIYSIN